jgi:tetratricopeptide (TPR) repeat protein
MLAVMAGLIVGAIALQAYAVRRGNQTIRIEIQDEVATPEDDDAAGPADDGGAAGGGPVSEAHAKARVAARRGHLPEALALFAKAVAATPDDPTLLGEHGYWLTVADQPERALPILEKADRLRPSAQSALRLGNARRALDDRAGAEREYRRALALVPTMAPARIALGNELRKRGQVQEALELLSAATGTGSNEERARAFVALGTASVAAGRRADAEKAFDRAIAFAPARAEIRIGISRAWMAGGKKEDAVRALAVLARAAELAPDLPAVWSALGRARERTGETAAALEAYDRALRLDPSNRTARRRAIRLALQARDFARARHDVERLVADAPQDPENQLLAASVAEKDGRRDDARKAYQAALQASNGKSAEAWLGIGQIERASRNTDGARAAFRKAIERRPGYTAAWLALGKLEESANRPADAERAYRRAIEIDPRYAQGWLALGQLLADRKEPDAAIRALRQALVVRPGYPAAELSLGVTLARAGRLDEAIAAYRALVEREPRYVSAWFDLALAYRKAGRLAEARAALVTATGLDGGHLPSRRELGDLNLAEGRLDEARTVFQEVLDLEPSDATARAALAQITARTPRREVP